MTEVASILRHGGRTSTPWTAEQRKAIATKASKAAAVARRRKAKERGAKTGEKIPAEQRRQGAKKAAGARWRKDKNNREEAGESTIQSEPTQLTSEEEETNSALVKSQLVEGVHLAMERNMILPFQLHVTGADDDLVCRLLCEKNGEREGWLRLRDMQDMPLSNTKLKTARFPMTATLTDSRGGTLELTI